MRWVNAVREGLVDWLDGLLPIGGRQGWRAGSPYIARVLVCLLHVGFLDPLLRTDLFVALLRIVSRT